MKVCRGVVLAASLGLASLPLFAQAQPTSAPSKASATDDQRRIERVMKGLFDKPGSPLEVGPVAIEGDHAVALARKVTAGEGRLPRERVKLFSLFKGEVAVGAAAHGHHPVGHAPASQGH